MESCRCEICNIDVHKASYAKQLRIKKLLRKIGHEDKTEPEWLFKEEQTPIKNKFKKSI